MNLQQAQQTIADMDAHKINWDDNLRAQANNIIDAADPAKQAQKLIDATTAAYNQQLKEYNDRYNQYTDNNPFVFDQVLQQEEANAKQRLDPYYTQQLGDYLQTANTQRTRSLEDERTLLTQLNQATDTFTGDQKQQLQDATDKAKQGAADAGIYNSGATLRAEGQAQADTNDTLNNFLTGQQQKADQAQTTANRSLQDISDNTSLEKRNLATNEASDVTTQGLTAAKSDQSNYNFARSQFAGTPPGVNPITYQNSLYSLLG